MNKIEMRKHYLKLRKAQPTEALKSASEDICTRLLELDEIKKAKTVMLYISFGAEVNTHGLIEQFRAMGKTVCSPLCDTESLTMKAYGVDGAQSLVEGAYGILEPKPEVEVAASDIDCILVPGCVFGRNFHRIGYGKGYYDRFLRNANKAVKIGICYELSLTENVEADEFDVPVDVIVTEKGVLRR